MISESSSTYWYAIRTRYHQERIVRDQLEALGFITYLPMRMEQRQWSDRIKMIEVPLIPNLVFLHCSSEEANTLVAAGNGFYFMQDSITQTRLVIPERQMSHFMQITKLSSEGLTLLDTHLKPGNRVRVIGGNFVGVEGELIRVKGHKRVVVRLEGLFALATTYIPSEFLIRI